MWVYTYKFDKVRWFIKCKAKFIIKGDQWKRTNGVNTYAAILAGKNFKVLLVIVAKFDLKLHQYNVVNAFIYTKLNKVVYIRIPLGY